MYIYGARNNMVLSFSFWAVARPKNFFGIHVVFLRTITTCTELDLPKILPVDVLAHCIVMKYKDQRYVEHTMITISCSGI